MTLEARLSRTSDEVAAQVPDSRPRAAQDAQRRPRGSEPVQRLATLGAMILIPVLALSAIVLLVSQAGPETSGRTSRQTPPAAYTGRNVIWPAEGISIDDGSPRALALSIADQLLGTPSAVVEVSSVPIDDPVWLSISLPSGSALRVLTVPRPLNGRTAWRIIQLGDNPPAFTKDGPAIRFMAPDNAEQVQAVLSSSTGTLTVGAAGAVVRSGTLPISEVVDGAILFFYDAFGSLCGVQAALWPSVQPG